MRPRLRAITLSNRRPANADVMPWLRVPRQGVECSGDSRWSSVMFSLMDAGRVWPRRSAFRYVRAKYSWMASTLADRLLFGEVAATNPSSVNYFYGRISRDEAESVLRRSGCQEGLYLLRENMSTPGNYALSICHQSRWGSDLIFGNASVPLVSCMLLCV